MLAPDGIDAAIDIEVPDDVVTQRMLARGRDDDTPEAIPVSYTHLTLPTKA